MVTAVTCDGFGFARLSDHVDSLPDPDGDWQRPQLLVKRDQHPWLHGRGQAVQKVVGLGQDRRLAVQHGHRGSQETSHGHGGHQLAVAGRKIGVISTGIEMEKTWPKVSSLSTGQVFTCGKGSE